MVPMIILEFNRIDNVRTVFMVVNRKAGNKGFLLGDETRHHFHMVVILFGQKHGLTAAFF